MRKAMVSLLALVLLLAVGCASGSGYVRAGHDFSKHRKVAVVKVTGEVRSEAGRVQLMDYFNMELMKKGFTPVERSQIQEVISEQKFQRGKLGRPETAAELGRILNVDAVVIINVPQFGQKISMTAKMVDVDNGSLLWIGEGEGSTGRTVATITGGLIGAGAGIWAGGDRTGKTVGGIAGGILGGVAGEALSPQEAETARDIIGDMCADLPNI